MTTKINNKGKGKNIRQCKDDKHLWQVCKDDKHLWQVVELYKKIPGLRKKSGALLHCMKCGVKTVSVFDFTIKETIKKNVVFYKKWKDDSKQL